MGSIRANKRGKLFFDFYYRGVRCREATTMKDTVANRRRLERVLKKIEKEIREGSFSYANYFPNSKRAAAFAAGQSGDSTPAARNEAAPQSASPASTLPSARQSADLH